MKDILLYIGIFVAIGLVGGVIAGIIEARKTAKYTSQAMEYTSNNKAQRTIVPSSDSSRYIEGEYIDLCVKYTSLIYDKYGKDNLCTRETVFSSLVFFVEKYLLDQSGNIDATKEMESYIHRNSNTLSYKVKCEQSSLLSTFDEMKVKFMIMDMMTADLPDRVLNEFISALFFIRPMVNDQNVSGIIDILKDMWWDVFRNSVPPFMFENMLKPELPSNERIISVFNQIGDAPAAEEMESKPQNASYSPTLEKIYKDPGSMTQKEIDETEDFLKFMGIDL